MHFRVPHHLPRGFRRLALLVAVAVFVLASAGGRIAHAQTPTAADLLSHQLGPPTAEQQRQEACAR